MTRPNRTDHIRLTSHAAPGAKPRFPIAWGAATPHERGPVIGTVSRPADRNVIGTHGGSYALYRALAVSSGTLNPIRRADLTNTQPAIAIGPFKQWTDARRIVSLDPWGHVVAEAFQAPDCRRDRYPPQHRRDAGPARSERGAPGSGSGPASHDGAVVHATAASR